MTFGIDLILAINVTRTKSRCTFGASQHIQASFPTCTVMIIGIIPAYTNCNIFLLLLLMPTQQQQKERKKEKKKRENKKESQAVNKIGQNGDMQ